VITLKAPAKVNLFLEVTGRRRDGYHELATIFARVGLCDTLKLAKTKRSGIRLAVEGGRIEGSVASNIVYKAAEKFFRAFKINPCVTMRLRKKIPVGAGLGGGSSDAAAALLGLGRLYKLSPAASGRKLMRLAAELGSDVPFFLLDRPAAAATGRGELLRPIELKGKKPWVVLVYPGQPVYTKTAYSSLRLASPARIRRRVADFREFSRLLAASGLSRKSYGLMFNRLEDPVLPSHPAVAVAKNRLLAAGAEAVLMSGSGATVFALATSASGAAGIARELSKVRNYKVYRTKFC
jgi:4-diphosphocytidyl-2-C-methyl-D-erythritol kinase